MLMDVPSGVLKGSPTVHNDTVQFVKPYIMITNVVKAAMVIVVTFKPDSAVAGLVAPLAGSGLLFLVTLYWFHSSLATHRHTQTHTDTHRHTQTQHTCLFVCLFVCFIASQHTVNQLRLQQYTTKVYVSSKSPFPSLSRVAQITHSVQAVVLPVHKGYL